MYLYLFIFGLLMGSFLCCMCDRLLEDKNIWGFSCCDHCGHRLSFLDLFPVFGFLFLKGKCRYCHHRISATYPIFELISGILFMLSYRNGEDCNDMILHLILSICLFCISYCDFKKYVIPDLFLIVIFMIRILMLRDISQEFLSCLTNALMVSFPLFIVSKISEKELIGEGDIRMFFVLGSYLSMDQNIMAIFLSGLFGLFYAVLFQKRKLPFAPSISLAYYLMIFYGEQIMNLYHIYI